MIQIFLFVNEGLSNSFYMVPSMALAKIFLCLNFLICKLSIIIVSPSKDDIKIKCYKDYKDEVNNCIYI